MNKFLEMHIYHADPNSKKNIMRMECLSNKEKLQAIFDIDKEELKKQFPELYYAILAVLDEDKLSYSGAYFEKENK